MTDKELVEGCIREDRKYQKILWNLYSSKLMALCLRYCKNQEEAEDALMESFVRIYDKIPTFRYQSSLETWMRRITVNISINSIADAADQTNVYGALVVMDDISDEKRLKCDVFARERAGAARTVRDNIQAREEDRAHRDHLRALNSADRLIELRPFVEKKAS